jgi:hypothetical protein
MKINSLFILLVMTLFGSAKAGQLLTCPNLEDNESAIGFEIIGALQPVPFKNVLISLTRVLGRNMVVCKYDTNLSLIKKGNLQAGQDKGLWSTINLGGLSFKQCLATTSLCEFYFTDNST